MTAFTIDAGDILLNETAKVDLLFDAVPVVRGDTGDPCTVSPATCTGYKHITYPGPPEPNDPPTSATGAPGAIHAPDHVLPIGNSSYHCFDTWEDTLNNEVYVLLESFSESSPDWQKKNTMIAFTFLGEYNLDNGYTFGSMEVPHGVLEEAKFYDDGTTDLDGLYEALAQPVFAHMIANNLMGWAGGYMPTAPFGLPQTVEFWKNCHRKPIMKYENEGLPRPPHGGGADAQMYGGNWVWVAGVSNFNTGGAGFGYLADATFRSAAGTNPLIKYGGDPTISGSDPNQYIEYCPTHSNYPYYPPNGIYTGGYQPVNIEKQIRLHPVAGYADSYNGQGFDQSAFHAMLHSLNSGYPLIAQAYSRAACESCPSGSQWDKDSRTCVDMLEATEPCTGNKQWVKLTITDLTDPAGSVVINSGEI